MQLEMIMVGGKSEEAALRPASAAKPTANRGHPCRVTAVVKKLAPTAATLLVLDPLLSMVSADAPKVIVALLAIYSLDCALDCRVII
jgi:hypothetical protein